MSIWERLSKVDSRVIYTLLLVVIAAALIKPMGLSISISDSTRQTIAELNKLQANDILVVSFDYDTGAIPELQSSMLASMRIAFQKGARVIVTATWPVGASMGDRALASALAEFPDKKDGIDYLNIGYKPGGQVYIEKMINSVTEAAANVDNKGRKLDQFPIMKDFKTLKDAKLVVAGGAGNPGIRDWIQMYSVPLKKPLIGAIEAVSVPLYTPSVQSGQLTTMLGGMRAAAEMEIITGKPGSSVAGMDAQSLAHLLVILLIALGNVNYLLTSKKK